MEAETKKRIEADAANAGSYVAVEGQPGVTVYKPSSTAPAASGGGAAGGRKSYDMSAYLAQQHASKIEAELAGLKSAYDTSVQGYDAASEELPTIYQQAKNQAAAQNAMEKRAFDERAAASGLGSGTNAQAQLAMSSVYQAQLAANDRELAQKQSDIQMEKAKLQAEYEAAISQARAQGNANLANALYQEMIRVQGLNREDEQIAAEWKREDDLLAREEASAETELARKIALEYELIDPANIGQIKTLADLAALSAGTVAAAGGNPAGGNPTGGGNGYDNGGLTDAQIRAMQRHFGAGVDGMWGPASVEAAGGMTAVQAWEAYAGRTGGPPIGALSASLVSGAGDQAIVEQAKKFVEAYPTIAWNSRTVDYMLADSGLTPAERALFKEYLKEYAPTWGTNAK